MTDRPALTPEEIEALKSGLQRMRQAAKHSADAAGCLWPRCDACVLDAALAQNGALSTLQQEQAQHEEFRRELSARVACSSPDGHAELGAIDSLKEEHARITAERLAFATAHAEAEADAARLREALERSLRAILEWRGEPADQCVNAIGLIVSVDQWLREAVGLQHQEPLPDRFAPEPKETPHE